MVEENPPGPVESINFGEVFASDASPSPDVFVIYIPDRDRNNRPVADHEKWVDDALDLLTKINQGATAYPSSDGRWKESKTGKIIKEKTRIVYSYVTSAAKFVAELPKLKEFLHRFGRTTKQDAVVFEFRECFYTIRCAAYDRPTKTGTKS